jgi:DNA repair exonuclease SbcCD nuclease subunit
VKTLFIGDLHVQINNLEETASLFDLIDRTVSQENPDLVVFLGDLYHTHSVVRQEVVALLQDRIGRITSKVIVLAGNHDGSSPLSTRINAVRQTLGGICTVVDDISGPFEYGPYCFVGFIGSAEEFVRNLRPAQYLVCHQTFNGAQYENGFYAPDGIEPQVVSSYKQVISGHIHQKQIMGNIFYVGTPRPVTSSEVFELQSGGSKHIYLHIAETNEFLSVSTLDYVRTQYRVHVNKDTDLNALINNIELLNNKWFRLQLYVEGTEEYCKSVADRLSGIDNIKIVPSIIKNINSKINADSGAQSVDQLLHYYLMNIVEEPQDVKELIWQKLQKEIPNLGKTSTC